ncbi:MAG: leucine-rich repeat domain-containing protein, partial [Ruminococcaceae bacterium]|nr:leucine-rich repeat domain-containing protein [Oscillospiraceae bacterium]
EERYNGKCNMANYHWNSNPDMPGTLGRPWEAYTNDITRIVIESGVNSVGQMAFYGLPNLTEVVLADSVDDIRNYAFKNCTSLTTIDLNKVVVLREGAFYGCSSLTDVDYSNVVVIAEWVFSRTGVTYP